jgi:hypothetical protein
VGTQRKPPASMNLKSLWESKANGPARYSRREAGAHDGRQLGWNRESAF